MLKTKRIELIQEIKNIIMKEVIKYKNTLDSRGCKTKIEQELFIDIFINKLETNLTWERLGYMYKLSKSHIHKTFNNWSDYGVFKNAFNTFLKQYNLFIDNNEAYIDSTTIFNKYGYIESTGFNSYESKKHKCNKLSIISSKNGIPLNIHISNGDISDINLLIKTLPDNIYFNTLYADKGYVSNKLKQDLLINKNIKLIYPYKRNQQLKNTMDEKIGLRNRMRIEHLNNKIKQNKSINTRYVKNLLNFKSLLYIGCLKIGIQIIMNDFFNAFL